MKKAFYLGLLVIGLIIFFVVRIYTFDHQGFVKGYLDKLAGDKFEITAGSISPLKISSVSYIEIKNILIKDKNIINKTDNQVFSVSHAKIELSLIDLLIGKKNFNIVKLTEPTLNFVSAKTIEGYIDHIKQTKNTFKEVSIIGGKICDYLSKDCEKYISKFDLKYNNKKIESTLNLNWGMLPENKFSLTATFKKNSEVSASIKGESGKFNLIGKIDNSIITGNITGEIFNPKLVLKNIIKPFELPKHLNIATNQANIKVNTQITLGFSKLELENIKFDSEKVNGTGKVNYLSEEDTKIHINFDKFIVDEIQAVEAVESTENLAKNNSELNFSEAFNNNQKQKSLEKISDKETSLKFKELVLGKRRFNDLVIDYAIKDNLVYKANVEGTFNNDIKFALNNSNYNQDEQILRSEFNLEGKNLDSTLALLMGKDALNYKDKEAAFSLVSKLRLSATDLRLSDIELRIADAIIKGNLKKTLGLNTEYTGNIDFSNFDFNQLSLNNLKDAINYFYFQTNEKAYLAKFKVLRDLKDKIKLDVKINNSAIDSLQINELTSEIVTEKGQLKINNLAMNSDFAKINNLQCSIDGRALNPKLKVDIEATKLDLDYIIEMLGLNNKIQDTTLEEDKEKIRANATEIKSIWSNDSLKWFRFDKFLGSIKLDLKNVSLNKNNIDKIFLSSTLKDETFIIEPFIIKWNESDTDIKGAISRDFDQTIISINFTANNIDLASLTKFANIKKVNGGRGNFTGNIYTAGSSEAALFNNLMLTAPFAIRDFSIDGFDLENLILKTANEKFNTEVEVKSFLSKAFETKALVFSKVTGIFKATKGVLESKEVNFNAPYSAGVFGGLLDLNKMVLKGQSNITFIPGNQAQPIVLAISSYGNLKDFSSSINYELLQKYLMSKTIPKEPSDNY